MSDIPAGLDQLIEEAVERGVRRALAAMKQPQDDGLVSASQADRLFRLRAGTARALWQKGRVGGAERPGRGRYGKTLMLRKADLERELGVGA
jgi:hypothetical protein